MKVLNPSPLSPLLPYHGEDVLTLVVWDLSAAGSVLIHHGWAVTEHAKTQFYFWVWNVAVELDISDISDPIPCWLKLDNK